MIRWKAGHDMNASYHSLEHIARHTPSFTATGASYITSQECLSERDQTSDEMAKAYPDDNDFEIACRFNLRQQS